MPGMLDANFADTLTLVCEHSEDGAAGFIVNRPTDIPLSELLEQQSIAFDADGQATRMAIYSGGPVDIDRGFVIHSPDKIYPDTQRVSEDLCVTASQQIIEDLAQNKGPEKALFLLGYAGWGGEQLEQEVADNVWLTTDADASIIFDKPDEDRCQAAATQLGVDLQLLNTQAGHA
ncbi:unnamed protein product [Cyprideis torosa]|uniref:Uncharacterized protein n=1 Tax=Cyprideis torosa TaxID=163714 RepID=A0A7R8WUA4_9CRUS|nr:unnamed protein product [Cyprideis torosa]CAG0908956.1 unnamed protein product [Cyprideis torosa]